MNAVSGLRTPQYLIRFCGADCGECRTYRQFLAGDPSGVVNPETGYRCCWLPADHPEGRDCPMKACCDRQGVRFCGQCDRSHECDQMQAFYAQPGYEALRRRMLDATERAARRGDQPGPHSESC